jgi:6-pyruvoyltetrahydropterin/6-carboxytetrahydropterin synthase
MTLSISKEFSFSASHLLEGLPVNHKCGRLHGHTYRVRVEFSGERDPVGFIIDYGELEWVRNLITTRLDHRHLNDVLDINPTAENIAEWLCDHVATWITSRPEGIRIQSLAVAVSETSMTWATSTRNLSE